MMELGMSMIRLKMCHFSLETAKEALEMIRCSNDCYSRTTGCVCALPIALDIQGSEIRTGLLKDLTKQEIYISQGDIVYVTSNPDYKEHVTEEMIYVDFTDIEKVVETNDTIFFNNGSIKLSVVAVVYFGIKCLVENGGTLMSRVNVYLPGVPVDLPEVTEKDLIDIKFGIDNQIDVLFVPGIKTKDAIIKLRNLIGLEGKQIQIIPKIDCYQALQNIDEIISAADGLLINRSALAIDMPSEKLFIAQKSIIAKCNMVGKLVICASHLLTSMMANSDQPTNSEICDISNAILDGIDCFLLSQETSIGTNPIKVLSTLNNICKEAEDAVYQKQLFQDLSEHFLPPLEPIYALGLSAVQTSLKCKAAAIIMTSTTGRSAKTIAMYRPRCPIIAITRLGHVARLLHMYRAIAPLLYIKPVESCWCEDNENRIQFGITWGKLMGIIRAGDALITVTGSQPGAGFKNTIRIVYASEYDTLSN